MSVPLTREETMAMISLLVDQRNTAERERDKAEAVVRRLADAIDIRDWSVVIDFLRKTDWTGAANDLEALTDALATVPERLRLREGTP